MSIPRSKLLGMQVYNPDGTYVGTVQDIALPIGEGEISIQVLAKDQSVKTIEWSKIAAAGDIIILKEKVEVAEAPVPEATQTPPQTHTPSPTEAVKGVFSKIISRAREGKPLCPHCGKPLTYIKQYQRWYCYNCKRYV